MRPRLPPSLVRLLPLLLTHCGGLVLAGGLGLCSAAQEDGDVSIALVAPEDGAVLDAEPFEVEVELSEHAEELGVDVLFGGIPLATTRVPGGQRTATIEVFPVDAYGLPFPTGEHELKVELGLLDFEQDAVTVQWIAPWEIASVEACSPLLPACASVAELGSLAGAVTLTPRLLQDAGRLVGVALRIEGEVVASSTAAPFELSTDLAAWPDGPVTLTFEAERDDGRVAMLEQTVEIANCTRLLISSESYVVYGDDATRWQATLGVTAVDLPVGTARTWSFDDGRSFFRLHYDDQGTLHAGYSAGGTWIMAIDGASDDPPEIVAELPISAGVGGLDRAPDGTLYATSGDVRSTDFEKRLYKIAGGAATEVTTTPLPADDVLVDDDGTLLAPAGEELWRLTVSDGLETAREVALVRPGGRLIRVALDELGRIYLVDLADGGSVVRYDDPETAPEVLYVAGDWTDLSSPRSLSFFRTPQRCFGLALNGPSNLAVVVDVGEVRGRP